MIFVFEMGSEQSTPASSANAGTPSSADPLYSLASPVNERQESVCSEADTEVLHALWFITAEVKLV